MGRRSSGTPPQVRNHNGYARVRWNGQENHLGRYGSTEAGQAYARIVQEWLDRQRPGMSSPLPPSPAEPAAAEPAALEEPTRHNRSDEPAKTSPASNGATPEGLTIYELCDRYLDHVTAVFGLRNGKPSPGVHTARMAVRPLLRLGQMPAASFSPKVLKGLIRQMEQEPSCRKDEHGKPLPPLRNTINKKVQGICRIFKWAVSEELVDVSVFQSLKTVELLKENQTRARESVDVEPVSDEVFEATLKHLPPLPAVILRLHRSIGCRPGEICRIRPCDIVSKDGKFGTWVWRLPKHKNSHRGQIAQYSLGPRAQTLLTPFLSRPPSEYCFQSAEGEAVRNASRRMARKSPMTPSHRKRREKSRRKYRSKSHFTVAALRRAITRVCKKHGLPHWHPHQVRHTVCSETRDVLGPEFSQARAGHKSIKIAEHYAKVQLDKAAIAASKLG